MKKNSHNKLRKVAVLLGDPGKSDPVKKDGRFNDEDFEVVDRLKEALKELKGYEFIYLNNHDTLNADLKSLRRKVDYAFNLCDEGFENIPSKEADIPLMLEELGIFYTGAGAECMMKCYNKEKVKELAEKIEIQTPKSYSLERGELESMIEFPVIVKPVYGDGGFGITQKSVAHNKEELREAISDLKKRFSYKKRIMLEEFLTGDEISVGMIGNSLSYEILPLIKENYSNLPAELPKICGHEAKWRPESPYWSSLNSVRAELPEPTRKLIEKGSLKLANSLGCRDYLRVDWRFNSNGNPKLLEVNPNPGWCWDGHLAKMANFGGISYSQMLEKILKAAEKRIFNCKLNPHSLECGINNVQNL